MLNFLRTDDQFEGSCVCPTNGKLAGLLIIKHELLVFEMDFGPFASVSEIIELDGTTKIISQKQIRSKVS